MADLVTHACVGALLGLRWGRGALALSVAGSALPDVVSRVPGLALEALGVTLEPVHAVLVIGHAPLGSALWVGLLAQLFADRRTAAGWLGLGVLSHYVLDLLQDHHGVGYRLLVPLSGARWELGWIGSEATVDWAVPLLVFTALAVAWFGERSDEDRRRTTDEGSVDLRRR
ncbi:MAG: metal-dependent hydrolase [Deltaproteobacteria bacterium]|nr:MAG: metal-dependent hydrolase [Deltaproteobacteria bacterium]